MPTFSTMVHGSLGTFGFTPGIGLFFDLADGLFYLVQGDLGDAGWAAAAAAPGWGDGAKIARFSDEAAALAHAPQAIGALDDASRAAFRAADNVGDFTVPLKHQPWAGGNYGKFADGLDQRGLISEALRSDGAMFLQNNRAGSFRVLYDFGRPIGTRGETGLRVIVGDDGRIWTAFPVKP